MAFDLTKAFQGSASMGSQGAYIGNQLRARYGKKAVGIGSAAGAAAGFFLGGLSGGPDPNLAANEYEGVYDAVRADTMRRAQQSGRAMQQHIRQSLSSRGINTSQAAAGVEAANQGRIIANAEQSLLPVYTQMKTAAAQDRIHAKRIAEHERRQGYMDTLLSIGITGMNMSRELAAEHKADKLKKEQEMKQQEAKTLPSAFETWDAATQKAFLQGKGIFVPDNWDSMTPEARKAYIQASGFRAYGPPAPTQQPPQSVRNEANIHWEPRQEKPHRNETNIHWQPRAKNDPLPEPVPLSPEQKAGMPPEYGTGAPAINDPLPEPVRLDPSQIAGAPPGDYVANKPHDISPHLWTPPKQSPSTPSDPSHPPEQVSPYLWTPPKQSPSTPSDPSHPPEQVSPYPDVNPWTPPKQLPTPGSAYKPHEINPFLSTPPNGVPGITPPPTQSGGPRPERPVASVNRRPNRGDKGSSIPPRLQIHRGRPVPEEQNEQSYIRERLQGITSRGEGGFTATPIEDPTTGWNIGIGRSLTTNGMHMEQEIIPFMRANGMSNIEIEEKLRTLGIGGSEGKVRLTTEQFNSLFPKGITQEQSDILFNNDYTMFQNALRRSLGGDVYDNLNPVRKMALLDMIYTMGEGDFRGFDRMIDAIRNQDWDKAAAEMKDAEWYTGENQPGPRRVDPLAEMMRTGRMPVSNQSQPPTQQSPPQSSPPQSEESMKTQSMIMRSQLTPDEQKHLEEQSKTATTPAELAQWSRNNPKAMRAVFQNPTSMLAEALLSPHTGHILASVLAEMGDEAAAEAIAVYNSV